jgi:hypothetical protein
MQLSISATVLKTIHTRIRYKSTLLKFSFILHHISKIICQIVILSLCERNYKKSVATTNLKLKLELSQIVDILHHILLPEIVQKYLVCKRKL